MLDTLLGSLALAVVLVGAGFGLYLSRFDQRIPVTGIDLDTGRVERRRLKPRSDGSVTWLKDKKPNSRLTLDLAYALRGARGPEFLADVSEASGTLLQFDRDGEVRRMPGSRLEAFLGAGIFKEIAESSKTDMTQVLNRLIVWGSVLGITLILAVVGVLYKVY